MAQWLIPVTLGMFLGLNVLGVLTSYAVILIQPDSLKIQQRQPVLETLTRRLPLIALNVAIICSITAVSIFVFQDWFVLERPAWWALLAQVAYVSVIDDFFFYLIHRWLHQSPTLYRRIHKIHHRAHTPVPIEYLYVHPLEWLMGLTGVVAGLVSLALIGGGLNVWTFLIYSGLRQLHELHIHSGLKSLAGRFIPFWGTSEHHDRHHEKPTQGNYSATYTLWDLVFRTRIP